MTVREALRAQRKAMKDRSLKENIAYLWDYYGMKAILLIIVAIALLSTVVSVVSRKDSGFCGAFFGVVPRQEAEQYLQDFAEAAGIDTGRYSLSVQVSPDIRLGSTVTEDAFQHMQRFSAMVASKTADTFAANQDLFLYYSYAGYTLDLRTVLPPEQLAALSPWLYYIDGEMLAFLESNDDPEFTLDQCPDPSKPEDMADPIPVAVSIQATTQAFQDNYPFVTNDVIIGICVSSEHTDHARAFLQYALGLPLDAVQKAIP